MVFGGVLLTSVLIVVVVGAAASQQAVLWVGVGMLALGAVLVGGALHWPMSDRYWDAVDEYFAESTTPVHVGLLGGLVAVVGAVVALVGLVPW